VGPSAHLGSQTLKLEETVNLNRLGHLHDALGCHAALVVGIITAQGEPNPQPEMVNLVTWSYDAHSEIRRGIVVAQPAVTAGSGETFHLSGECPWKL